VIVDRSKPLEPLSLQISDMENRTVAIKNEPRRGVFVLPPKEGPTVKPDSKWWLTLVMSGCDESLGLDAAGEETLEAFFGGLHEAFLRVEGATGGWVEPARGLSDEVAQLRG
jgi:hypothetical protein